MKNYPSPMLFVLLALFLLFSIVSEAFPSGQNIINIFTACRKESSFWDRDRSGGFPYPC